MMKVTQREEELVRAINIFQTNAIRSIDGVLIGLKIGIDYLNIHLNRDVPSLEILKELLEDAKFNLMSFKIEIAEDYSTISLKNTLDSFPNCSERDLIYGISSFERNVSLCFERLKIESPKHEQLCTDAQ